MRDIIQGTAEEVTAEEVTEVTEVIEIAVITDINQITSITINKIIIKDSIKQIIEIINNF